MSETQGPPALEIPQGPASGAVYVDPTGRAYYYSLTQQWLPVGYHWRVIAHYAAGDTVTMYEVDDEDSASAFYHGLRRSAQPYLARQGATIMLLRQPILPWQVAAAHDAREEEMSHGATREIADGQG